MRQYIAAVSKKKAIQTTFFSQGSQIFKIREKCDEANMTGTELREGLNEKKTFSFGHCPNKGGRGLPMPEFFGPLFRSAFLVNKKSLFRQKCQCIDLLTVF